VDGIINRDFNSRSGYLQQVYVETLFILDQNVTIDKINKAMKAASNLRHMGLYYKMEVVPLI